MPKDDLTLGVRLPASLVKRIDAHLARIAKEGPMGAKLSRSDAVRNLLVKALDAAENRKSAKLTR